MLTAIQTRLNDLITKTLGVSLLKYGIQDISTVDDQTALNIIKFLEHPARKNYRFNLLNRKSERDYRKQLEVLLGSPIRINYYHNSHQLLSGGNGNPAYNQKHSNGITLVVATSPNLTQPIYGYSICGKSDTYSRLLGRSMALGDLVTQFDNDTPRVLTIPEKDVQGNSVNDPRKYFTEIIKNNSRLALPMKVKPVPKVNPLSLLDENRIMLEVKEAFAEKFGTPIKDIKIKFGFVRFYENSMYKNLIGTTPYIKSCIEDAHKDDHIAISSFGGWTVASIELVTKEDKKLLFVTHSQCLDKEQFIKSYGRMTAALMFLKGEVFNDEPKASVKPTEIFSLVDDGITDVQKIDSIAIHVIAQQYQLPCNQFIGLPSKSSVAAENS